MIVEKAEVEERLSQRDVKGFESWLAHDWLEMEAKIKELEGPTADKEVARILKGIQEQCDKRQFLNAVTIVVGDLAPRLLRRLNDVLKDRHVGE